MNDRASAREVIDAIADTFDELDVADPATAPDGPLGWPGYDATRQRARLRSGETEAVVCGLARIGLATVMLIVFEFAHIGGSLGEVAGHRLQVAHETARARGLAVVTLIATGGSRMQEGTRALSQLARVAAETQLTAQAGLPQIAVLRDPSSGGGWAVLGPSADVLLALPDAQVGFAGSRVRPADADPEAYTARSQLAHGHIDAIVPAEELRDRLRRWLSLLTTPASGPVTPPRALGRTWPAATGWEAVATARDRARPRAQAYLDDYFDWYETVSGDRHGQRDPGTHCGIGWRDGAAIAFAAQTGTPTPPAGFRTASRLVRLADRFGIPVLTLIDTPGAANDAHAERQGVAGAIAELFGAIATARVPVTSLLIGEGGSGGAMAFTAVNNTWATPDSYFAVIAPEAAAAILKRSPRDVPNLADQLRLRPADLHELGVIQGIVEKRS